jgi:aconitate hydratase
MPDTLELRVLIVAPDDISTGDLSPDGATVMAYRSNVPAIAEFTFQHRDPEFPRRAKEWGGGFIVAGDNYGQGSSREHAAIVPRYLGLRAVLAKSIARIHGQNLVNFAVLPLTFTDPADYGRIDQGDVLGIAEPAEQLRRGERVEVVNETKGETYAMRHRLTPRQVDIVARGSLISVIRDRERA